ncbi:MAG: bifunctional aspartate kinase/homoserine dehydrogenase I [Chitinophagaceae bacterium]|nr:bifunctional aspartate kinase/homoserine dehydrogenase I [Chitinophagaceae bacterium]
MRVLKFGGSSVANTNNLERVFNIVKDTAQSEDKVIIVLSALSKVTDSLIEAAETARAQDTKYSEILNNIFDRHLQIITDTIDVQHQSGILTRIKELVNEVEDICKGVFLVRELTPHTRDLILSYGELLSTLIFSEVLKQRGIENRWMNSGELIKTDSEYSRATIDIPRTTKNIKSLILQDSCKVFIFPGFTGSDSKGNRTTLGRGGSDYTASALGAIMNADIIEIWTDVSGMMTADPSVVKNAKIIHELSYEEALELSHFGAKVIYPKTIAPAFPEKIPILVKNTFHPEDRGTKIHDYTEHNGNAVRGLSSIKGMAVLTLEGSGMIGIPGFSKRLFETLASEKINVILITQSSSEYSICVVIEDALAEQAQQAVDNCFAMEIQTGKLKPAKIEKEQAIVAIVGDSMKSRSGISGKMFGALGRNGVNVRAIAQGSSERNISAVISSTDVKKALNVLHEEFFENTYKEINLYICGTGNVGKKLLEQLRQQADYLKEKLSLNVKVAAIANSRKMLFGNGRIDLNNWQKDLDDAEQMNMSDFIERIQNENRRNSIFVDITANADVARQYPPLLQKSISVVACNKIACSSEFSYYQQLKSLARRHNVEFLFETNVGAGLPIINTLNDLLKSGDEIIRIEAVLSGTLNFVFNEYDGTTSFADVVRKAAAEGYTEPDPRLDLSGTDVMRKILILARESGYKMELSGIENTPFLPAPTMEGSIENFYDEVEKHEAHFKELIVSATKKGNKLKYVATFENGKAQTGLKEISPDHDFYHLYGKDNIVLFYTKRYSEQPLIVKGAGAGAEVTASGVFADILRAVR